jgi:methyl-accepting chemotaxis protein
MEKNKSLSSRMLLSLGLQIACVFLVAAGAAVYLVNSNFSGLDQAGTVSNSLLLIFGIGLVVAIVMIALALKGVSNRIAQLAEITERLAAGDTEVTLQQQSRDQLDDLGAGIVGLAENIKYQALVAKKLADGDLSVDIQPVSENDLLGKNLAGIRDSVKLIETATAEAAQAAQTGILVKNETAKALSGHYRQVIENVHQGLTAFSEQSDFYLAVLDALPYRITAINMDREIVFVNKILGDLMKLTGTAEKREDAYGRQCSSCNLEMCSTENCGIRRLLEKGLTEFSFFFRDRYYRMDTVHLIGKNGEEIGFVDISHDTTPMMSVNDYTHKEIKRLSGNLLNLADGNLDFDLNMQEAGEYTAEISAEFVEIEKNLEQVKQSIGSLIENAAMLSESAIDGNLDAHADETKFRGSWQHLIVGMNRILEEIAKPTREIAGVMNALAVGSLQVTVEGEYKGEFDNLKQSVNVTVTNLNTLVAKISEITGQIADKNLDIESVENWPNDFEAVSDALNKIVETMNALLGDIDDAARQVTAGSNQVSDASQALAQGSTEQASSVQELSAAVAEISDQTKNNAVNANQARELATDVQDHAARGNAQMAEMQNSMAEINKSSNDISKIIKVIDDIAFQTNILALNAAVEAARAGQHGKGFAVVAEEVRTLAARSAEAAQETTGLIEGSIDKVKAGTRIADETAAALNEIVERVVKVTDLVGKIAVDSNEQASGIAQVNMGIEQVAQVVQNNSATAEESAAASEELSGQAELLKDMIEQFHLRK